MISPGARAPAFTLEDHLGRVVASEALLGRKHLLICFYPLDFTPT